MLTKLVATFEVLTPLFLGGADQCAELRPPSIKGLLRFWYRAVNPCGLKDENRLFGGTVADQGQSPFFLSIEYTPESSGSNTLRITSTDFTNWDSFNANRFNGMRYLGYPFPMQDRIRERKGLKHRTCLKAGTRFTMTCLFPREPDIGQRQGILSAIWLLGHVGNAGSRSRRGFGGFALTDWKLSKEQGTKNISSNVETWEEMNKLPLLCKLRDPKSWGDAFQNTLALFSTENWFASPQSDETIQHPHFGKGWRLILGTRHYSRNDWLSCLDDMGLALQGFRQRSQPDYQNVKQYLQGQERLLQAPERSNFGLPLTFRFRSLQGDQITFMPEAGDRHASLLFLKSVLIGESLYPLYLRLAGNEPGDKTVRTQPKNLQLKPNQTNAMDQFLNQLQGVAYDG